MRLVKTMATVVWMALVVGVAAPEGFAEDEPETGPKDNTRSESWAQTFSADDLKPKLYLHDRDVRIVVAGDVDDGERPDGLAWRERHQNGQAYAAAEALATTLRAWDNDVDIRIEHRPRRRVIAQAPQGDGSSKAEDESDVDATVVLRTLAPTRRGRAQVEVELFNRVGQRRATFVAIHGVEVSRPDDVPLDEDVFDEGADVEAEERVRVRRSRARKQTSKAHAERAEDDENQPSTADAPIVVQRSDGQTRFLRDGRELSKKEVFDAMNRRDLYNHYVVAGRVGTAAIIAGGVLALAAAAAVPVVLVFSAGVMLVFGVVAALGCGALGGAAMIGGWAFMSRAWTPERYVEPIRRRQLRAQWPLQPPLFAFGDDGEE